MEEASKIIREVTDMGASAYLMMIGFDFLDKKDKSFLFEMGENDVSEFEREYKKYLKSDFHRFDACLVSLKKWGADNNRNVDKRYQGKK